MTLHKVGRPSSLTELAYAQLRSSILSGDFSVNERMSVVAIAERMGMSRSPVRAAVERLAAEGLLQIRLGGVEVVELGHAELLDALVVRSVLEGLSARLAAPRLNTADIAELRNLQTAFEEAVNADDTHRARRIDLEFHQRIQESTGNSWLMEELRRVQARVIVATYSTAWTSQQRHALGEHRGILAALADGAADHAERAAIEHIERLIGRVQAAQAAKAAGSNGAA